MVPSGGNDMYLFKGDEYVRYNNSTETIFP